MHRSTLLDCVVTGERAEKAGEELSGPVIRNDQWMLYGKEKRYASYSEGKSLMLFILGVLIIIIHKS